MSRISLGNGRFLKPASKEAIKKLVESSAASGMVEMPDTDSPIVAYKKALIGTNYRDPQNVTVQLIISNEALSGSASNKEKKFYGVKYYEKKHIEENIAKSIASNYLNFTPKIGGIVFGVKKKVATT